VGLVDDEGVIVVEEPVGLRLGEEHAVGHELDEGVSRGLVAEADLVADQLAEGRAELFGDACGDGASRDASRLGDADDTGGAAPQFEAEFGQLRGLARAGLAAEHDDLVAVDRFEDVAPVLDDGQVGRIAGRRRCGAACCGRFGGVGDPLGEAVQLIVLAVAQRAQLPGESMPIATSALGEPFAEGREGWHGGGGFGHGPGTDGLRGGCGSVFEEAIVG